MTPYGHPIVPLLIDLDSMHGALPEAKGPKSEAYPGGTQRARWHMQEGLRVFKKHFDCKPKGVWLSEGAVSREALQLLDEFDIVWSASGEGVWNNSRYLSGLETHGEHARRSLFCANAVDGCDTRMFFRDDGLSDMIGFEYQQWEASDAAADFEQHLRNISHYLGDSPDEHVVSVILDGENAWEYYPDNAYHFLGGLYARLTRSPHIHLMTFAEAVDLCPAETLSSLCPGSWVYGSFSTWIGEPDKNIAWDLLIDAKKTCDAVMAKQDLSAKQRKDIERQLAICEGSDWFWWFGDYNPADSVSDFDRLYRRQLKNLYDMLGVPSPASLDKPVSSGGGDAENSGTMRRGHAG